MNAETHKTTVPRVFVGTMYAGEAEFEACQSAIARQRNVEIKHTVIRNLGEDEAHRALWQAWDAVKSSFDMFAKIDGDTILVDDDALQIGRASCRERV